MSDESDIEDIVVEFEGNFDLSAVADKPLQIIGLDEEEPVLRIDTKFYKIDVKDSIGSRLIFKRDSEGKLQFHSKTDKVVTARRVMVKPK